MESLARRYDLIVPDWPAPRHVQAASTVRYPRFSSILSDECSAALSHAQSLKQGGVTTRTSTILSTGCYAGLNLGDHVQDSPEQVEQNRQWLARALSLPSEVHWLNQTHSTNVLNNAFAQAPNATQNIDAILANRDDGAAVCAVLTADCLPVLFCDEKGRTIAAAHAGWRGLLNGILENTVAAMTRRPHTVMAWFGPAIGAQVFEVGAEVVEAFCAVQTDAKQCFARVDDTHWLADLVGLARLRLNAIGVKKLYGGEHCTFSDAEQFYSYRRDGQTGRQASLIWFDAV